MDGGLLQPAIGQMPQAAERGSRDPAIVPIRGRTAPEAIRQDTGRQDSGRQDWRDVILNDPMRIPGHSGPRPHY